MMSLFRAVFLCSLALGGGLCSCAASAEAVAAPQAVLAPGWVLERVGTVDQSYAGWDVEIGDADNDGANEILTTGCPDSRLHLFKKTAAGWQARQLADNLAEQRPGMGLAVRVADLNGDGRNEVLLGTGQEGGGTAFLHLLETDGQTVTRRLSCRPEEINRSSFTHNIALHDLDGDGVLEAVSAYCGYGEVIRYDFDAELASVTPRKIHHLSGSGEESLIADVDNDGRVEYLTSNGFRAGKARLEIFEFDDAGELAAAPRVTLDGPDGAPAFYVSLITGDLDNDGRTELVAGWKREQAVNRATLTAYRVGETAEVLAVLDRETEDLDMAYFEKMMAVADADNDGRNELVVGTRGDAASENITSGRLGRVYRYALSGGAVEKTLLADFAPEEAESLWLAVGDVDNDGKNEIVLATGAGDRTQPGRSQVFLLRKP